MRRIRLLRKYAGEGIRPPLACRAGSGAADVLDFAVDATDLGLPEPTGNRARLSLLGIQPLGLGEVADDFGRALQGAALLAVTVMACGPPTTTRSRGVQGPVKLSATAAKVSG